MDHKNTLNLSFIAYSLFLIISEVVLFLNVYLLRQLIHAINLSRQKWIVIVENFQYSALFLYMETF